jgi:hypothetical protein
MDRPVGWVVRQNIRDINTSLLMTFVFLVSILWAHGAITRGQMMLHFAYHFGMHNGWPTQNDIFGDFGELATVSLATCKYLPSRLSLYVDHTSPWPVIWTKDEHLVLTMQSDSFWSGCGSRASTTSTYYYWYCMASSHTGLFQTTIFANIVTAKPDPSEAVQMPLVALGVLPIGLDSGQPGPLILAGNHFGQLPVLFPPLG